VRAPILDAVSRPKLSYTCRVDGSWSVGFGRSRQLERTYAGVHNYLNSGLSTDWKEVLSVVDLIPHDCVLVDMRLEEVSVNALTGCGSVS